MSDSAFEIEMDCTKCGRYSTARFAGVWDEIELDRKRAGGVL